MIEGLLALARLEAAPTTHVTVDLAASVHQAVARWEPLAEERASRSSSGRPSRLRPGRWPVRWTRSWTTCWTTPPRRRLGVYVIELTVDTKETWVDLQVRDHGPVVGPGAATSHRSVRRAQVPRRAARAWAWPSVAEFAAGHRGLRAPGATRGRSGWWCGSGSPAPAGRRSGSSVGQAVSSCTGGRWNTRAASARRHADAEHGGDHRPRQSLVRSSVMLDVVQRPFTGSEGGDPEAQEPQDHHVLPRSRRSTWSNVPRWSVREATTMIPIKPAAANGVSSPSTRSAPEPISVQAAAQAWSLPGFIPRLSNQPAVPGILPPRNTLLNPCRTGSRPRRPAARA